MELEEMQKEQNTMLPAEELDRGLPEPAIAEPVSTNESSVGELMQEETEQFPQMEVCEIILHEEVIPEEKLSEEKLPDEIQVSVPEKNFYILDVPAKKLKKHFWKKFLRISGKMLAALIAAAVLVSASSVLTAFLVDLRWQHQADLLNQATQSRLQILMDRIEELEKRGISQGADTSAAGKELTPAQVYAQNVDAVVLVTGTGTAKATDVFGKEVETGATGTGFFISQDGYVVTNYHVVQGMDELSVSCTDGQDYSANLIGYDEVVDIAVLKVGTYDRPCVKLGSSDHLLVGEQVVAIGNPLGDLSSTLTVGYLSAKDRMVYTSGLTNIMLQTDAAINSGNSGGPLFNMAGEVVGITTSKYSGFSSSGASIEGIGFAIPMDQVVDMIMELKETGKISRGFLGVTIRDVTALKSAQLGIPMGASVDSVEPSHSADRAGVQPGDIIVDIGGYQVTCVADLSNALHRLKPGVETTITVYRDYSYYVLQLVLDAKPE